MNEVGILIANTKIFHASVIKNNYVNSKILKFNSYFYS